MANTFARSVLRAALLLLLAAPAVSLADRESEGQRHRRSVPEFDLAALGAVGALLAGGGYVLARRRK